MSASTSGWEQKGGHPDLRHDNRHGRSRTDILESSKCQTALTVKSIRECSCVLVHVDVAEGTAVRGVGEVSLAEFGEQMQGWELMEAGDGHCNQPLEAAEDGFRQGAERRVGDVPTRHRGLNGEQRICHPKGPIGDFVTVKSRRFLSLSKLKNKHLQT